MPLPALSSNAMAESAQLREMNELFASLSAPPCYDDWFSSEEKIVPMLKAAGFSEVCVLPFWGCSYFRKLPLVRSVDAAFTDLARRRWRAVSSFACVVAVK